jgi:hypothetical protein
MDYFEYSKQLSHNPSEDICLSLIKSAISDQNLSFGQKYFIYNQLIRKDFLNQLPSTPSVGEAMDDLYQEIYDELYSEVKDDLTYIPFSERKPNMVFVVSNQVLSVGHAPTKTLFDRCHALRKMGKEIMIINTADLLPRANVVPWEDPVFGSYIQDFCELEYLEFKGEFYHFFQCPNTMPEIGMIKMLLDTVKNLKPEAIVTIGGNNLFSDLCSNIVTTMNVSTVFSGRVTTQGTFQIISRPLVESDLLWAKKHGKTKDHFIVGTFTFSLCEQNSSSSRKDFGIPEDRFVAIVSGLRLDSEIDHDFIQLLIRLMNDGLHVVFIGIFDSYEKYSNEYPIFKTNSTYLGVQKDVLAINELCDIYINPHRKGGGTSAVEALVKGVPVVTDSYGDVSVSAGPDFSLNDTEEMYERVIRLKDDVEYREKMKKLALERANILLDSDREFERLYNTAIQRTQKD